MNKTRYLTTADIRLHKIWRMECMPLDIPDDFQWEEKVREILTRAGYRIVK
jgi:hypothetical protein